MLLARGLLMSILDNAYHHATPLDDHLFALNLRTGRTVGALLLNMNLHRTHHRQVRLPWNALPEHADTHPDDPEFWQGIARQWPGPIPANTLRKD